MKKLILLAIGIIIATQGMHALAESTPTIIGISSQEVTEEEIDAILERDPDPNNPYRRGRRFVEILEEYDKAIERNEETEPFINKVKIEDEIMYEKLMNYIKLGIVGKKEVNKPKESYAYSEKKMNIKVNGKNVKTSAPIMVSQGTSLIPLRDVAEFMGAEIQWVGHDNKIIIKESNKEIFMQIDNKEVIVEANVKGSGISMYRDTVTSNLSPKLINNKTYVPLRLLGEIMQYNVSWDQNTSTASLDR